MIGRDEQEGLPTGKEGSLSVVGTGIRFGAQITPEARSHIEAADKVLSLVADVGTWVWLCRLSEKTENIHKFYGEGKDRSKTYLDMVEYTLSFVRQNLDVCLVSYGHPGVFAYPMHEFVRRARDEGYDAKMLPGISAEDCLFAELGFDPGSDGCQSFEATDFLLHRRKFDPCSLLILWQIGVIGEQGYKNQATIWNRDGLRILTSNLLQDYKEDHLVTIYECAVYAGCKSLIHQVKLSALANDENVTPLSTLLVPPKSRPVVDPEMARLLLRQMQEPTGAVSSQS